VLPDGSTQEIFPDKTLSFDDVKTDWPKFLKSLEAAGRSSLYSSLSLCELEKFSDGVLLVKCKRSFAYELLEAEAFSLTQDISKFFNARIHLDVFLSKDKADFATDKTPFEQLKDLTEKNKMLRKLIDEFGAELAM